jgi:hypothetical protein
MRSDDPQAIDDTAPARVATPAQWSRRPRVRAGAVIALAIAAGVIVWLVVGRDDNSSSPTASTPPAATSAGLGPVAMSPAALRSLAQKLHHPVYWAGARNGYTYEVTETADGKVYVRYLPKGVKVHDPRANFLIVATYPYPDALAALKRAGKQKVVKVRPGAFAFVDPTYPKSVHMAFPHADYQIEVFDPSPKRSRAVALSGDVRPVG